MIKRFATSPFMRRDFVLSSRQYRSFHHAHHIHHIHPKKTTSISPLQLKNVLKTKSSVTKAYSTAALLAAASSSVWNDMPLISKHAFCSNSAPPLQTSSLQHPKPAEHINDITITLYQYKICPFCNKIKAMLDYYGLKYTTIEVNPLSKNEIKTNLPELDYKKVPICVINNEVICDSPVILNKIQEILNERGVLLEEHKDTTTTNDGERNWLEWVDNSLAVLLFPNITRNFPESWQAFSYISDVNTFSMPVSCN
jgi:glutaredoxin